MEYYSAIKENEIMPFATPWMDLEGIILNEITETVTDKYHDTIYMWDLSYNTNELTYKTESVHRHRKQTYGYQRGKGGEGSM